MKCIIFENMNILKDFHRMRSKQLNDVLTIVNNGREIPDNST